MKRSRHTEEQIIAILREQEAGAKTANVCRKHGISSATFYHWKAKYERVGSQALTGTGERECTSEALRRRHARQLDAQRAAVKKMVTPAVKREAVVHLRSAFEVSERRACSVIEVPRMTVRYRSRRPDDVGLRERLKPATCANRQDCLP